MTRRAKILGGILFAMIIFIAASILISRHNYNKQIERINPDDVMMNSGGVSKAMDDAAEKLWGRKF